MTFWIDHSDSPFLYMACVSLYQTSRHVFLGPAMLERLIPNYEAEVEYLNDLGNAGWIMGFGISYKRADHLVNRYPVRWSQFYEDNDYIAGDPVLLWTLTKSGAKRWSEMRIPDVRGVLIHAAQHGLKYGATCSQKFLKKRCFITVSRNDREVTDSELAVLNAKFDIWCKCVVINTESLSEGEKAVLTRLAHGMDQAEIAAELSLSVSGVKARLISIQRKLGTTNATSTVAMAIKLQII